MNRKNIHKILAVALLIALVMQFINVPLIDNSTISALIIFGAALYLLFF
ncbi:MAG: hypothetical protein ACMXYF_05055 [Candidatus Woesearchaeota archaeon]